MCVVPGADQRLVSAPHAVGNVLGDLKASLGIEPDALQIPDDDADDVRLRQRRMRVPGEVLVQRHGDDILWVLERKCWFAWTGKRWEASSLEEERRAQALADDIFKAACATKNRNAITAALKVQTRPFQRHALELARSRRTASILDFDQHPLWLDALERVVEDLAKTASRG